MHTEKSSAARLGVPEIVNGVSYATRRERGT